MSCVLTLRSVRFMFMWYSCPWSVTSLGGQCPKISITTTHPQDPHHLPTFIANSFFYSALLPPPHILVKKRTHTSWPDTNTWRWGLPVAERGIHHHCRFMMSWACISFCCESSSHLNPMLHREFHTHCLDCPALYAVEMPQKYSSQEVTFWGVLSHLCLLTSQTPRFLSKPHYSQHRKYLFVSCQERSLMVALKGCHIIEFHWRIAPMSRMYQGPSPSLREFSRMLVCIVCVMKHPQFYTHVQGRTFSMMHTCTLNGQFQYVFSEF